MDVQLWGSQGKQPALTQSQALPVGTAGGGGLQRARVAELLGRWQYRELELAKSFGECRALGEEQLKDLYQELTLALAHRPYTSEKHLQRTLRKALKRRALNLRRDERRRQELLAAGAPSIHVLEAARSADQSPERLALLSEDKLLINEFLAELTEDEEPVFWLMAEGMGYNRIATALAIPIPQARILFERCERKREKFVLLYESGRLCGYRARTIQALNTGQLPSEQLVATALAHLDACPHCRTEHRTNAKRLKAAFNGKAAALLPIPVIAARVGLAGRIALHTRLLAHRVLPGSSSPGQGVLRERGVALAAGSGASAKLAAGILTAAAVVAGSTLGATHILLERHNTQRHHHHPHTLQPGAMLRAVDLAHARPVSTAVVNPARRTTPAWGLKSPGHAATIPHPPPHDAVAPREPGGFAYLGVPATRPVPHTSEPTQTSPTSTGGGPFSP